jgi:hypothetical protein
MKQKTTWAWTVICGEMYLTGTMQAYDPRNAVLRAMTSDADDGKMVGELCKILPAFLSEVPANESLFYETMENGCYIAVKESAHPVRGRTMMELKILWELLRDVPVAQDSDKFADGEIETAFLSFEPGTPREDIWHWFEKQNPAFVVGEVQQGIWPAEKDIA